MENSSVNSSKNQTLEFVRLSVTLFVIAGVMALIVALVNNITAPVIADINEKKTSDALMAVLPEADGFTDISADVELADAVEGVWRADNGAGFCVKVCPQGYGGAIETIVGFDKDGTVVGTEIIAMSETSGIDSAISVVSQLTGGEDDE